MKLLICLIMAFTSTSHAGISQNWKWFDRRMGAGLAPDRLFLYGEYGHESKLLDSTFALAFSPTLISFYLAAYHKPFSFLVHDVFVNRTYYYRSWKGTGLIPANSASPYSKAFSDLTDSDSGIGAAFWQVGYHLKLYWSTLNAFSHIYEGLFSFISKAQWFDSSVTGDFFYDPSAGAIIGRREWVQDLTFFGGQRMNPQRLHATRFGLAADAAWLQTGGFRQSHIGPALQSQAQDSPFDFFIAVPIKIENPFDPRSIGVFLTIGYKD